jgi:hypothetical protein
MSSVRLGSLFLATLLVASCGGVAQVGLASDQRRGARPPPSAETLRAQLDQGTSVRRGEREAEASQGNPPGGSGFFVQRDGGQVTVERTQVGWQPAPLLEEHYVVDERHGWMLVPAAGDPAWAAWEVQKREPAMPPAPVQLAPEDPARAADQLLEPREPRKYIETATEPESVKKFKPMRQKAR